MCPVVDVYHRMASLPTLYTTGSKIDEDSSPWDEGGHSCFINKDILLKCQRLSFDPGDQKAVNRIHSTSLILHWQNFFCTINFCQMLASAKYF